MRLSITAAAFFGALSLPLAAQPVYDPVDYLMLTPGTWRIEQVQDPLGYFYQRAWIVTVSGPFTLQQSYISLGGPWTADEIEIFEVTATNLFYHGRLEVSTGDYVLFTPAVSFPRSVRIGDVVHQKVTMAFKGGSTTSTFTALFAAGNVTQTVPSGTYPNCLRVHHSILANEYSETQVDVRAKDKGVVWSIFTETNAWQTWPWALDPELTERTQ